MADFKLELIEIITHCCDVKTFRFELTEDVAFKPGQYLALTLDINRQKVTKAFSMSNAPTEKGYVEFTKKLGESDFSKALNRLEIGRTYSIRMPMGNFTFEEECPKAAFLSGGIGITPVRSIFKYVTDKKLSSSLVLLHSSRSEEYLIFKHDFSLMQKENKNLKIIYTLTHCAQTLPGCRAGRIDEAMIKEEIPDYRERKFFLCGPPQMVEGMFGLVHKDLSVSEADIITENFIGY